MVYEAWQTAALKVYDRDATTLRDEVSATGVRWTDELKGEGGASYTVPWLQTALSSDPDLLRDAVVKALVPLTDGGTPEAVMAWLSQPGSGTLVGSGEDADKEENPACRGIRALLDDWVLLHDGGFSTFGGTSRYFGWMSRVFDDSAWVVPIAVPWEEDDNPSRAGYPAVFAILDPEACWLGLEDPTDATLANGTIRYFRGQYVNPVERKLRITAAFDNYGDMYVNGEPVYLADDSADAYGWREEQQPWDRVFAAGEVITIAVKVRNAALTSGTNPLAFILTMTSLDDNGNPDEIVFHSDASTFLATDDVTGLTGAMILLTCNEEAQARGVTSASLLAPTFTSSEDTDDVPWADVQERGWEIGTKGSQILEDLEALAFDVDVRPDLSVDAYVNQGSDLSASVAITKGATLLSYTYDGQPLVATRLLVRTSDRWLYLTDSVAEATYSPREHFLESGLSLSADQGTSVGDANLDDLARESFAYTAVIVCTTHPDSVTPYADFGKGDVISAYNYRMERADLQVVSISGEVPDDGIVRWTLELREP